METNIWITFFEKIDIHQPPELNIRVFKGNMREDFVKENYNVCMQLMHDLKRKIGYLTDSAKLKYLEQLNPPEPRMPDFGQKSLDSDMMAQAFYQSEMYYYEFIKAYKEYLRILLRQEQSPFVNSIVRGLPEGVCDCWYIDEETIKSAQKNKKPIHLNYAASEYFKVTAQKDSYSLEGYLGRADRSTAFFEKFDPTITYFINYEQGQNIFFTFDRTALFKVVHVITNNPLLWVLKKINVSTMTEERDDKPLHQTIIHAGRENVITTGNNNSINVSYTQLKGNLEKLKGELLSHHVSASDADEIADIVQHEPLDHTGKLPVRAESWVKKMVQKSLDGIWEIGIHVAGGLLVEILKGYYGIS